MERFGEFFRIPFVLVQKRKDGYLRWQKGNDNKNEQNKKSGVKSVNNNEIWNNLKVGVNFGKE